MCEVMQNTCFGITQQRLDSFVEQDVIGALKTKDDITARPIKTHAPSL